MLQDVRLVPLLGVALSSCVLIPTWMRSTKPRPSSIAGRSSRVLGWSAGKALTTLALLSLTVFTAIAYEEPVLFRVSSVLGTVRILPAHRADWGSYTCTGLCCPTRPTLHLFPEQRWAHHDHDSLYNCPPHPARTLRRSRRLATLHVHSRPSRCRAGRRTLAQDRPALLRWRSHTHAPAV